MALPSQRELGDLLGEHAAATGVVGAAVGMLAADREVTAFHGRADIATGSPVEADTRFEIASIVKPMVATAVARLAAEGHLALDDPIGAHVPEAAGAVWSTASIDDFLGNWSGVPLRASREFDFRTEDPEPLAAFVRDLVGDGRLAPPRTRWSYSNGGWIVLGRLLERMTGRAFAAALRSLVWEPLAMDATRIAGPDDGDRIAADHEWSADGARTVGPWRLPALAPAGSGVVSTVDDLLRFARAHAETRPNVGFSKLVQDLRVEAAVLHIPDWIEGAWCRGWARYDWPGGPVWGWDGVSNGQRAVLHIVPGRGAAVLLTNTDTGRDLYRSLFPIILPRLGVDMQVRAAQPRQGAFDPHRYAGRYGWPDAVYEVRATANRLEIVDPDAPEPLNAQPIDESVFLVRPNHPDVSTIAFGEFDAAGRPGVLYEYVWAYPRLG